MYSHIFLEGKLDSDTVQIPASERSANVLPFFLKQNIFLLVDSVCFVHSKAQRENCMLC